MSATFERGEAQTRSTRTDGKKARKLVRSPMQFVLDSKILMPEE